MKKLIVSVLTAMSLVSVAQANDFTFSQAGVRISTPSGMELLSRKDIELLYPPTRGPGFVIGNAARTVTVTYDMKDRDISGLDLSQALTTFSSVFERRVPALAWKYRKVIDLEKQKWLQLEFTSRAMGVDYYNIMLITPIKNQMLVLNLNSTVTDFPTAEPLLRGVIKSIALNVPAPQPVINPAPTKKAAATSKK